MKIRSHGRELLSMQDAYFNLTYVDARDDMPLDYLEMLLRLAKGEHTSIKTVDPDYRQIPSWPKVILAAQDRKQTTP